MVLRQGKPDPDEPDPNVLTYLFDPAREPRYRGWSPVSRRLCTSEEVWIKPSKTKGVFRHSSFVRIRAAFAIATQRPGRRLGRRYSISWKPRVHELKGCLRATAGGDASVTSLTRSAVPTCDGRSTGSKCRTEGRVMLTLDDVADRSRLNVDDVEYLVIAAVQRAILS